MVSYGKGIGYLFIGGGEKGMVESSAFWDSLCTKFNYRYFTGVPCYGLSNLYLRMNKSFMHYVPTVNERIAVDMANGAIISGVAAGVLLGTGLLKRVNLDFNFDNLLPLLIISSGPDKPRMGNKVCVSTLTDKVDNSIRRLLHNMSKGGKPGVLFIKEGMLI